MADRKSELRNAALRALRELAEPGLGAQLDSELAADAQAFVAQWQARHDELAAELADVDAKLAYWQQRAAGG